MAQGNIHSQPCNWLTVAAWCKPAKGDLDPGFIESKASNTRKGSLVIWASDRDVGDLSSVLGASENFLG